MHNELSQNVENTKDGMIQQLTQQLQEHEAGSDFSGSLLVTLQTLAWRHPETYTALYLDTFTMYSEDKHMGVDIYQHYKGFTKKSYKTLHSAFTNVLQKIDASWIESMKYKTWLDLNNPSAKKIFLFLFFFRNTKSHTLQEILSDEDNMMWLLNSMWERATYTFSPVNLLKTLRVHKGIELPHTQDNGEDTSHLENVVSQDIIETTNLISWLGEEVDLDDMLNNESVSGTTQESNKQKINTMIGTLATLPKEQVKAFDATKSLNKENKKTLEANEQERLEVEKKAEEQKALAQAKKEEAKIKEELAWKKTSDQKNIFGRDLEVTPKRDRTSHKKRNHRTWMSDTFEHQEKSQNIHWFYSASVDFSKWKNVDILTSTWAPWWETQKVKETEDILVWTIRTHVDDNTIVPVLQNAYWLTSRPSLQQLKLIAEDGTETLASEQSRYEFVLIQDTQNHEYTLKTNYAWEIEYDVYTTTLESRTYNVKEVQDTSPYTFSETTQEVIDQARNLIDQWNYLEAIDGLIIPYFKDKFRYTTISDYYTPDIEKRDIDPWYHFWDCDVLSEQLWAYLTACGFSNYLQYCYADNNSDWTIMSWEGHAKLKIHLPDWNVIFREWANVPLASFQEASWTSSPIYMQDKIIKNYDYSNNQHEPDPDLNERDPESYEYLLKEGALYLLSDYAEWMNVIIRKSIKMKPNKRKLYFQKLLKNIANGPYTYLKTMIYNALFEEYRLFDPHAEYDLRMYKQTKILSLNNITKHLWPEETSDEVKFDYSCYRYSGVSHTSNYIRSCDSSYATYFIKKQLKYTEHKRDWQKTQYTRQRNNEWLHQWSWYNENENIYYYWDKEIRIPSRKDIISIESTPTWILLLTEDESNKVRLEWYNYDWSYTKHNTDIPKKEYLTAIQLTKENGTIQLRYRLNIDEDQFIKLYGYENLIWDSGLSISDVSLLFCKAIYEVSYKNGVVILDLEHNKLIDQLNFSEMEIVPAESLQEYINKHKKNPDRVEYQLIRYTHLNWFFRWPNEQSYISADELGKPFKDRLFYNTQENRLIYNTQKDDFMVFRSYESGFNVGFNSESFKTDTWTKRVISYNNEFLVSDKEITNIHNAKDEAYWFYKKNWRNYSVITHLPIETKNINRSTHSIHGTLSSTDPLFTHIYKNANEQAIREKIKETLTQELFYDAKNTAYQHYLQKTSHHRERIIRAKEQLTQEITKIQEDRFTELLWKTLQAWAPWLITSEWNDVETQSWTLVDWEIIVSSMETTKLVPWSTEWKEAILDYYYPGRAKEFLDATWQINNEKTWELLGTFDDISSHALDNSMLQQEITKRTPEQLEKERSAYIQMTLDKSPWYHTSITAQDEAYQAYLDTEALLFPKREILLNQYLELPNVDKVETFYEIVNYQRKFVKEHILSHAMNMFDKPDWSIDQNFLRKLPHEQKITLLDITISTYFKNKIKKDIHSILDFSDKEDKRLQKKYWREVGSIGS